MRPHSCLSHYGPQKQNDEPNGNESAYIIFQAGKAHEGYFTNEDIIAQAECAMEILAKYYWELFNVVILDANP